MLLKRVSFKFSSSRRRSNGREVQQLFTLKTTLGALGNPTSPGASPPPTHPRFPSPGNLWKDFSLNWCAGKKSHFARRRGPRGPVLPRFPPAALPFPPSGSPVNRISGPAGRFPRRARETSGAEGQKEPLRQPRRCVKNGSWGFGSWRAEFAG